MDKRTANRRIASSKAAYAKARKAVTQARRSHYYPLMERAFFALDAAAERLAQAYRDAGNERARVMRNHRDWNIALVAIA